jgi:hypothetical protein
MAQRANLGVSMELTREAEQFDSGWQVLEKLKPVRKSPLTDDEAHLMHPDNRYRFTHEVRGLRWGTM